MRIKVIHNQHDLSGIGILFIQQPLDLMGPVFSGTVFPGIGIPPSIQWFGEYEDTCSSITDVLIILILYSSVPGSEAFTCISEKLHRLFVHTDNREVLIIWSAVNSKDILHSCDKGCILMGRNTPALFQVRLIFVFFRIRDTVTWDSDSA